MTVPTTPLLTVDAVIILNRKIVLIKRKNPPSKTALHYLAVLWR